MRARARRGRVAGRPVLVDPDDRGAVLFVGETPTPGWRLAPSGIRRCCARCGRWTRWLGPDGEPRCWPACDPGPEGRPWPRAARPGGGEVA